MPTRLHAVHIMARQPLARRMIEMIGASHSRGRGREAVNGGEAWVPPKRIAKIAGELGGG